jgi:hypothetical protein
MTFAESREKLCLALDDSIGQRCNKPDNHAEIFARPMTYLEIATRQNEKCVETGAKSMTPLEICYESAKMELNEILPKWLRYNQT